MAEENTDAHADAGYGGGGRRSVPVHGLAALAIDRCTGHEPEFSLGHWQRPAAVEDVIFCSW